jgi:hypothetical protein
MIVSLEAIFLAIIVLISQNRAAKIAELREEIDLSIIKNYDFFDLENVEFHGYLIVNPPSTQMTCPVI